MTKELTVGYFNYEGLHQLQKSFVANEDLRGQNVLQLTPLSLLREMLRKSQKQVLLP